ASRHGYEHDDEQSRGGRHREARHPRRHQGGREDRHHQRLPRRLVRRVHRQHDLRRLVRQRRLPSHASDDRWLAPGNDLARDHGVCAPRHRTQTATRPRPASAVGAASRGSRGQEGRRTADPPQFHSHQARSRCLGAARAADGRRHARARRPRPNDQSFREYELPRKLCIRVRSTAARSDSRSLRLAGSFCSTPRSNGYATGPNVPLLFGTMLGLAIAAMAGLGATWISLTRGSAYGGVTIGAWTGWPKNGTPGIDPYARAMVARTGELPVGSGDGVAFYARTDDAGQPLDGRCDVLLSGTTPQARFWTITLYDPEGRL